ncbi:MAG: M67 family metallopeptidase, partial [Gemmatimonadota bacterium]
AGAPTSGARATPGGDMLVVPASLARRIERSLEAAYPAEGCGVLLGEAGVGVRVVARCEPATNRWAGRHDRYRVDPALLVRLMAEEDAGGPSILGFYHSHPDGVPRPSPTDLEHAWPWYHYLILAVDGGRAADGRAWELVDGRFRERTLVRRDDAAAGPRDGKESRWRK